MPHLDPDLIGGEAAPADPHGLRVAHIDLEEVAGRPVGVIQVLRLGDQPPGVRYGLRHCAVAAAAAGSVHLLRQKPTPPPQPPAAGTPVSRAADGGERARRASRRAGGRSLPAKLRPRPLGLPPFAQGETADRLERRAPVRRPRGAPEGHCGVGPWRSGVTGLRAPKIWRDYNDHKAPGERVAAECYAGAVGRGAGELV